MRSQSPSDRRRRSLAVLAVIALAWIAWAPASGSGRLLVTAVQTIGMTVSDVDRAAGFYARVLSFEKVSDVRRAGPPYELLEHVTAARARVVRMRLGEETIELTEYLSPRGRPFPAGTRSNDRWFQHAAIIVSDMDRAYARLWRNGVENASTSPQRLPDWNPNAAGIRAFYFRDPDRHFLEVLQFPPDKGDARWRRARGLFLGIDHTAIVVGNTEESLTFYRDTLGLRVAGQSENYGIEQERLNNVPGAHLRITTLRAERGPGVELLEYLAPRDGRPTPADLGSNDLAHWETTMSVVAIPFHEVGFDQAVPVRDPDGHSIHLVEASRK